MDARASVIAAAVACMTVAVALNAGAVAREGIDTSLMANASIGLFTIAIGLGAGAGLYARSERQAKEIEGLAHAVNGLARKFEALQREVRAARKDIGVHKRHDEEALYEASGLADPDSDTGPQDVRYLRP